MPTVSNAVRVTTRDGAIWRTCTGCDALIATAGEVDRCDTCRAVEVPLSGEEYWFQCHLAAAQLVGAVRSLVAQGERVRAGLVLELLGETLTGYDRRCAALHAARLGVARCR
jgi:hypothetical protein